MDERDRAGGESAGAGGEREARAVWRGGYRCEAQVGEFDFILDEPPSVGGAGAGPQPTDLLLASVAGCFTLSVSHSAAKRGLALSGVEVRVVGRYDGPRFAAISVHADIGCAPDELDRLVRAAERVCYVTNTLRGGPEIEVTAAVVEGVDETG